MGESKSPAGKPDKKMSSHLLTMKFMQRAAASKEAYSNISPNSSAGSERHKPKRARLSTEAEKPRASDMDEITAALAAEEEKRQKALARAAEEAGETHWVLDVPAAPQSKSRPVVLAADSLDADDYVSSGGRQSFGNYKRKEQPKTVTNESDDEDLTYNPADSPKEQERKKSKLERKQAKKEQKERSSDKNLGNLSSISGSGGRGTMMGSPSTDKKKKRKSR